MEQPKSYVVAVIQAVWRVTMGIAILKMTWWQPENAPIPLFFLLPMAFAGAVLLAGGPFLLLEDLRRLGPPSNGSPHGPT